MTTKLSQRQTDIRNWLATILPQHKEALLGSDDFATIFKTGVILCDLANHYRANSVNDKLIHKGKMSFKQMENINYFLSATKTFGINDLFIFVTVDLFEEKNLSKVVDCLFEYQKLISPDQYKSAQKTSKLGPSIQINLDGIAQTTENDNSKDKNVYLNSHRTLNDDEHLLKTLKYNPQLALACQNWIEGVLGETMEGNVTLEDWLKDGVIFCRTMNKIKPDSITEKQIYKGSIQYRQIETITIYTKTVKDSIGINANDMFDISDLFESKNFNMVLTHINALANKCETFPDWKFPKIANTSQAKNLLAEQLKGGALNIDEDKQDTFTEEEQKIVDWVNKRLPKTKPVKNFESLRTGVKIVKLLRLFFPKEFSFSGIFVEDASTLLHCLSNADYIINNIRSFANENIPGVRSQDIGAGSRKPLLTLLNYMKDKFDFDSKFEAMLLIDDDDDVYIEVEVTENEPSTPSSPSVSIPSKKPKEKRTSKDGQSTSKDKHDKKEDKDKKSHRTSTKSATTSAPTSNSLTPEKKSDKNTKEKRKSRADINAQDSKDSKDNASSSTTPTSTISSSSKKRNETSEKSKDSSAKAKTTPSSAGEWKAPNEPSMLKKSTSVFQIKRIAKSDLTEEQIKANAARKMTKLIGTEVLTTEESYLSNLTFLVQGFADKASQHLTPKEYNCIFANVKDLQKHHTTFLTAYRKYVSPLLEPASHEPLEMADLVRKEFEFLPSYEHYLTNFPTANFCLNLLKAKYSNFNNLVTEFGKELNAKNGLSVSDVLIMPVQRLPRYIMLFQTLQKYSNPQSVEYRKLTDLQDYITTDLLKMNSKISPDELKEITNVHTFISAVQDIDKERVKIELDRRIVEKAKPFKITNISNPSKKNTHLKQRTHFTLFNDILLITKIPKKKLLGKDDEEPVHSFLDAGVIKNPGFAPQSETDFTFTMNGDTFTVSAEDKDQCILFVSAMNKVAK